MRGSAKNRRAASEAGPMTDEKPPHEKLSILQVVQSVLAASIGVQSTKNRERDFKQGSAKAFIIVGLIATMLFILTVYTVVKMVLQSAPG
jgi:hypothetical protein